MKLILKHLKGDEQRRFLKGFLNLNVFNGKTFAELCERQNEVIQAIMDEVNKE